MMDVRLACPLALARKPRAMLEQGEFFRAISDNEAVISEQNRPTGPLNLLKDSIEQAGSANETLQTYVRIPTMDP